MSKITLNTVGSLADITTAQTTINNNFSTVQTAFDNTLSRDGTVPNQMAASIDMNSNRILNLPQPATSSEPLRLQDLSSFTGGGTVTNIPAGGLTGQLLTKHSNTDYDVQWSNESAELIAGNNIVITGTGAATIATTTTPSFTTVNGNTLTAGTGTLNLNSKNLVTNNSLTLTGTDGTTMTFPTTSASIARTDAGQTLTGTQAVTGAINVNGTVSVASSNASVFTVGTGGANNPAFQVDSSVGSQVAGLKVTGAATGGTVALAAIDSGSNTNLSIDAKGTGVINIGAVSTGAISLERPVNLGIAGSIPGNLVVFNGTSGSITVAPPTGALGTPTITWPSGTDTIVARNTTDTLTNKTLTSPVLNSFVTGTGLSSLNSASTLAVRDANGNCGFNNDIRGYTTIATAGGTTTLTVASTYMQTFTGASNQNVTLPVVSGLILGFQFYIDNQSTGNLTVQSSGLNPIVVLPGGTSAVFTCILTSGTTAASWTYDAMYRAGQILGTSTNDNANANNIGEYVVSTIAAGSAVSLTTATSTNLTSISLTAGDWDVRVQTGYTGTWTSSTVMRMTLSTTTGTESIAAGNFVAIEGGASNGTDAGLFLVKRFSLSSTTTIFAVGRGAFAGGTMSFYGELSARRMR